jgi:CheY-like chemotaxis protein
MDHTHSQLPLDGLYDAYNELLLATKDDPSTHDKVRALAHYIPHLASRHRIRAVVDNSAPNSTSIDCSIVDYIGDKKSRGNCSSASAEVAVSLQASPRPDSPPAPSPTTINAGSRSALVVENDKSLLTVISELLKREGFKVRSARDGTEGLRLFNLFAPFDVVLIDYYVPQTAGVEIDYSAPQKDGIDLAMAVRKINPTQGMIIAAFDYQREDEVPRPTELMQVPVLVSTLHLRNLLAKFQYWATREEIDKAISVLSPAQWLKLHRFAECRVRGLGRSAGDRKGHDLLQDALLSTFIGAQGNGSGRRWNKRVDFIMHLTGAMRGISSHCKGKLDDWQVLECEAVKCDADGQALSPLDNLGSGDTPDERLRFAVAEGFQPAAERRLIAKEEVERLFRMFKNDKEVSLALQGLSKGKKKNEIMHEYELTAKQYDAATKRIRVKLLGPRNHRGGSDEHGK